MAHRNGRGLALTLAGLLMITGAGACGEDDETTSGDSSAPAAEKVEGAAAVDLEMRDYSFDVSGAMHAGGTLRMANTGKEFHMVAFNKLKGDTTLDQYSKALLSSGPGSEEDPTAELAEEVGPPGGFISPGQKAEIAVPALGAGKYALVCYIPTGGKDGKPHFTVGMIGELVVTNDKAPEPKVDATYKVAADKAIEGPATLKAGRRTLKIEAADGADEHEFVIALPNAGKTFADINAAFEAFGDDSIPLDAVAKVPGVVVFSMFDFHGTNTAYVTVDFKPGVYEFVGEDSDADNPDYKEALRVTVT